MDSKLENLLKNKDCFFIHYASDGFYNEMSPAPRISCISIFNGSLDKRINFSIDNFNQAKSVEDAEVMLLYDFKSFIELHPNISFIHWNMNGKGFGFNAIWARAKELEIELPEIKEENLFDLSSYIAYLSEKRLSIKQILWFNSLLDRQYLDGKDEALYFSQRKFSEISASVSLKVVGLYYVVEELKKGTLKTEKVFAEPNDGLTKEERRQQALKLAETRDKMINDIYEHNKRIQKHNEEILDKIEQAESESDEGVLFYDSAHPIISLFANWFANKK